MWTISWVCRRNWRTLSKTAANPVTSNPWIRSTSSRCLAVSRRRTAQASDDPLPHVAAQVEDQVADTVVRRPGPPPHLFVAHLTQAVLDPLQGARQFLRSLPAHGSG